MSLKRPVKLEEWKLKVELANQELLLVMSYGPFVPKGWELVYQRILALAKERVANFEGAITRHFGLEHVPKWEIVSLDDPRYAIASPGGSLITQPGSSEADNPKSSEIDKPLPAPKPLPVKMPRSQLLEPSYKDTLLGPIRSNLLLDYFDISANDWIMIVVDPECGFPGKFRVECHKEFFFSRDPVMSSKYFGVELINGFPYVVVLEGSTYVHHYKTHLGHFRIICPSSLLPSWYS